MGHLRVKSRLRGARSVQADWLAWLPAEKDGLFDAAVSELETSYHILSVTLDEALALRAKGSLAHARVAAGVSADLFDRHTTHLLAVLRALEEHGRHFSTLPHVAALNPAFFRGGIAQRLARRSGLLHKVLFSSRSQFFHKLHALADAGEEIQSEFREAAEEIANGASVRPGIRWDALEVLHYDLNTCLRETIVVLKSFLCALPNEQVQPFRQKLQAPAPLPPAHAQVPAVRHRRATVF